jgi:sodium-dependent dicarboxylate transporter 2/3/5
MTSVAEETEGPVAPIVKRVGLWLGLALALGLQLLPRPEGLTPEAWAVASLFLVMAIWWVTEALPLPVTSLLPLVVLPLFAGMKPADAASQYANPILLLFVGGFLIAIAIERWGLSKRIAYSVVSAAGPRPKLIVGGFMLATALVSMWISNTATAMLMIPLALGVAGAVTGGTAKGAFAGALVLGVCYAATIGGVATPIGSPTNLIAVSWMEEKAGIEVPFTAWMAVGVPVMLALLLAAWALLALRLKMDQAAGAAAQAEVRHALKELGPVSAPEARVMLVFAAVAALWVGGQWLTDLPGLKGLDDMVIAIIGAVALFLIPAGGGHKRALMTWQDTISLPWWIILLFGGGLALADAATDTGLAAWIGAGLTGLNGLPLVVLIVAVVALIIALTEFASNVATISMMLPILAALVTATGQAPAALIVPAAIAASTGFMMPVGTAANAIAFGTGAFTQGEMIRKGFILNLVAVVTLTLVGLFVAPAVLG